MVDLFASDIQTPGPPRGRSQMVLHAQRHQLRHVDTNSEVELASMHRANLPRSHQTWSYVECLRWLHKDVRIGEDIGFTSAGLSRVASHRRGTKILHVKGKVGF